MTTKVFYSFHFDLDCWRTQTVRNIGSLDGNTPIQANSWEDVKKKGKSAIENWIQSTMTDRDCLVVLVGKETALREWVQYEIKHAWNSGKGVVGIRIHQLLDSDRNPSISGPNPFDVFTMSGDGSKMSAHVKLHQPAGVTSTQVYANIADNIESWVAKAIAERK